MVSKVVVLPGEGVGPEVITEAVRVLNWFKVHRGVEVDIHSELYGVEAFSKYGQLIDTDVFNSLVQVDAVLFGATGGPKFDKLPTAIRRSHNLLAIRKHMGTYANLRPIKTFDELIGIIPLKASVVRGADLVVVRELNGGVYFGQPRGRITMADGIESATNTLSYTAPEIERIARVAFNLARVRNGHVHSVDKSNVLEVYSLWRDVVDKLHKSEFSDIPLAHILVDNCAMQIINDPKRFDVVLADNMIGDILSDLAGAITGSLGMLPSVSFGDVNEEGRRCALYEPVHGSAPDIAGQGIANPLAAIMCIGLLLKHSLQLPDEALYLDNAIQKVLASDCRTPDIQLLGKESVSTSVMGDEVIGALNELSKG